MPAENRAYEITAQAGDPPYWYYQPLYPVCPTPYPVWTSAIYWPPVVPPNEERLAALERQNSQLMETVATLQRTVAELMLQLAKKRSK